MNKYNVMKVVFAADCYSLNKFGRPIYGDSYFAMNFGTVPSLMKSLLEIKNNMPFIEVEDNIFKANAVPDMNTFSETDIEALQYGIKEYADLSFDEVKDKNHAHRAWKNHEQELKIQKRVPIPFEEMIDNPDVLADLREMGQLTENMGF